MDRRKVIALSISIFLVLLIATVMTAQDPPALLHSTVTADFNGDGLLDVATVNNGSEVSILLGLGGGKFRHPLLFPTGPSSVAVTAGDLSGDGIPDLVTANTGSGGTISILLGNGDGTFQPHVDSPVAGNPTRIIAADLKGDGRLSLITASPSDRSVSILARSKDGTFQRMADIPVHAAFGQIGLAVGDFNGDHKLDMAITANSGVDILIGKGDGSFLSPTAVGLKDAWDIVAADLNGDGWLDLATISPDGVMPLLGRGDGTFRAGDILSLGEKPPLRLLLAADFNRDHVLDLIAEGDTLSVLMGNGDGTFAPPKDFALDKNALALSTGDFNSDGRLDFAIQQPSGDVMVVLQAVASSLGLATSPNPSLVGQTVTMTATVAGSGGGSQASSVFTAPVENPLSESGKWIAPPSAVPFQKDGTGVIFPTAAARDAEARYIGQVFSENQFSQATLAARSGNASDGVAVRVQSNTNGSAYALIDYFGTYLTILRMVDTPGDIRFIQQDDAINRGRLMDFPISAKAGDVLRLEVVGNPNPTLTAYLNGTLLGSVVDTGTTDWAGSYPPLVGGQPGLYAMVSNGNSPNIIKFSNWSGGDLFSSTVPTGTVTFKDGATTLGSNNVNGSGQATRTTSTLTAGTHPLTATYNGDANFNASTSTIVNQVVSSSLASTTTLVTSSLNPAVVGQAVVFTASVSSGTGSPTGSVVFKDGATTLATVTLGQALTATYTTSLLAAGTHSITVAYGGDASHATSTSSVLSQVMTGGGPGAASATTLLSSLNPATLGQSVTLTASVVSASGGVQSSSLFAAPAENPLSEGGKWITPVNSSATGAIQKDSAGHILPATAGKDSVARFAGVTFTGDQFSQATISARNGSTIEGVAIRIQSNTNASGYALLDFYGSSYAIVRMGDRGNELHFVTPNLATFAVAPQAGDVIRLQSTGGVNPTLTAYRNGVVLGSVIDTGLSDWSGNYPPLAGGQPGVYMFVSGGGAVTGVTLSSWSGGDLFSASTPSGTITFKDGLTTLGSGALNASGVATMATSALQSGTHPLTAVYGGDGVFTGSTSAIVNEVVNLAVTSTALTSSLNPSGPGQPVTFTAVVTSTSGTPSGTVTFKDGAGTLGTGSVNASGQASFNTSALAGGTHVITAVYGGGGAFAVSTSVALNQVVSQTATTTTLSSSANPSPTAQAVTFTAVVSSLSGTPTGTITFLDGAATLGTGTLNASGQATFSTSTLTVATHAITAAYAAAGAFGSSTSAVLNQVITGALTPTATALVSSVNPSSTGQSVTFTATVSSSGATPTGSVTFKDGGTTLGAVALNVSGQAAYSTAALAAGSHSITAEYGGSATRAPSTSSAVNQVVTASGVTLTETALVSSLNPSSVAQSVMLTATVTSGGGGTSGLQATDNFPAPAENPLSEGGKWITPVNPGATGAIQKDAGGHINPVATGIGAMARFVGTVFTGDQFSQATISARGGSTTEGVTVRVQGNANASGYALLDYYGSSYTIIRLADKGNELRFAGPRLADFAVAPKAGDVIRLSITGSGNPTLTAYVNGVSLGSVVDVGVSDWSGVYPPLAGGQPGVYVSMSNGGGAVTGAQLSTWSGGDLGSGSAGVTGSVTFKDGAATLATVALSGLSQAALNTSALAIGSHPITAVYGGDILYAGSTSPALNQIVGIPGTITGMTSSANPTTSGQSVTFTVTVSGPGGTPTGVVTFLDGAVSVGTGILNGAGVATLSSSTLTVGTHAMTASYAGDSNFAGSSSVAFNQVVNPGSQTATSTTALTSSVNPSTLGQAVTFTASITPSAGTATGNVIFADGGTTIGNAAVDASGQATLVISLHSVGTRVITAAYGGNVTIAGSVSAPLNQVVTAASTHMTLVTSGTPSTYGQSVTFTAAVLSSEGVPAGSVTFMDGAASIGTSALTVLGQATLSVSNLSAGSHSITAVYGGNVSFATSTSPAVTQVVNQGTSAITIGSSLNPSAVGLNVVFTATISPAPVSGSVTFMSGASTLGTAPIAAGQATLATSAFAVGSYSMTAVFAGDSNVAGSTSPALIQVVTPPATSTGVVSSMNPSVSGQAVTLTATVTSLAGVPGGFVTFADGATTLSTVALSGSGQAALTTSLLGIGPHAILASYGGSASFGPSASGVLNQVVNSANRVGTFTAVASSLNPSGVGQSVTLTASVSSTGGGSAQASSNFNAPAENPLSEGGKWISPLNPASTAAVQKDALHNAFPSVTNKDAMARYVGTALSENQFSQATITARNGSTIEGVLTRIQSNSDGASYALLDVFGQYYSIVRLSEYSGDIRFSGVALATFVPKPATGDVIRLEVSGNPQPTLKAFLNGVLLGSATDVGQSDWAGNYPPLSGGQPGIYMFTSSAPVTGVALTAWSGGDLATGTVTFKDGATILGSAPLDATGKATFTTSSLVVGSHAITAEYSGDFNFIGSVSPVLNQIVNSGIAQLLNFSFSGQLAFLDERRAYRM